MKALNKLIHIIKDFKIFVKNNKLSGLGIIKEKSPKIVSYIRPSITIQQDEQTSYNIQQILIPPMIERIVEKEMDRDDNILVNYVEILINANDVNTVFVERTTNDKRGKIEDRWENVAILPAKNNPTIVFNDYNVAIGKIYYYRVYGEIDGAYTSYSNVYSIKIKGNLSIPAGLNDIQIETGDNLITISWTNLENRANYIEIYAGDNAYFVPTSGTLIWRGNSDSCNFHPEPNRDYYFKIIQRLQNGYYSNVYPPTGAYGPYHVFGDPWGKAEEAEISHQGNTIIAYPEEMYLSPPRKITIIPTREKVNPLNVWINNPLNVYPDVLGSGRYYEVVNKNSLNNDRNVKNVYNADGILLFDGDSNIIRRTDGYTALDLVNGLLGDSIQVVAGSISNGAVLGTENINPTFEDVDLDGYPDGWIIVTSGDVSFSMIESPDYGGKWTPEFTWSTGNSGSGEIISNFIPIGATGYQVKRMVASYLNFDPGGADLNLQIECWDKNKEYLIQTINMYNLSSSFSGEIKEEYDPNTEAPAGTRYVRIKIKIEVSSASGDGYLYLNYFRIFPKYYSLDLEFDRALDLNSQRIVNLADPISDYDAATKHYVDTTASGGGGVGMPEYVYIKATGQSPGNLTLSGTDWDTSKALIKIIRIKTTSNDYNIELYHNNSFDDSSVIPHIVVGSGLSGDYDIHLDYTYIDENNNNKVYLKYIDNDGGTHTADIYIQGYKIG